MNVLAQSQTGTVRKTYKKRDTKEKTQVKKTTGRIPNITRLVCVKCLHGQYEYFFPMVGKAPCPKCGNCDGHIPLDTWLESLIGADRWLVTDHHEKFYALPVVIESIESVKKIILSRTDGETGEAELLTISNLNNLYVDRNKAANEAFRLNAKIRDEEIFGA